jgi:hypothetical protein
MHVQATGLCNHCVALLLLLLLLQVHDIKGRLDQVVSLLKQLGFSRVTVEQPSHLQGTDLYNLYATRAPAGVQV